MAVVAVASVAGHIYTLVQLVPNSGGGNARAFMAFLLGGVVGVGYVLWMAALNRSLVIALLGPSDLFVAFIVGFFLVDRNGTGFRAASLLLAGVAAIMLFYPWLKFEVVLFRICRWSGLP